jgi:hypothetical protein
VAAKTYAQAAEQAAALLSKAALADSDSHFPYKADAVAAMIAENPPMGPGQPGSVDGAQDRSREVADYMSGGIAEATADYVAADQAYREDRSETNLDELNATTDRLVAARLDHRAQRGQGFTIGAAARRAA